MGTPDFAVKILNSIIDSKHNDSKNNKAGSSSRESKVPSGRLRSFPNQRQYWKNRQDNSLLITPKLGTVTKKMPVGGLVPPARCCVPKKAPKGPPIQQGLFACLVDKTDKAVEVRVGKSVLLQPATRNVEQDSSRQSDRSNRCDKQSDSLQIVRPEPAEL